MNGQPVVTGILSTKRCWEITISRKKSPGLCQGEHLVLTLVNDSTPINELSKEEWAEIIGAAHNYAMDRTTPNFNFRVAYNGPGAGTRKHVHIHIMLPIGNDKLPPLVERGS